MPQESESTSVGCGAIIGLALFIYVMIAYDKVRLINTTNLYSGYVDMINWTVSYAITEIVFVSSFLGIVILGICCACCLMSDENAGIPLIVMMCIYFLGSFVTSIVFMALGIPIKNNVEYICLHPDTNTTDMCNYYNNYFNPILIILIVIVAINCLAAAGLICIGCLGCLSKD